MNAPTFLSMPAKPWLLSLAIHLAFFCALLFLGRNRTADLSAINLDFAPSSLEREAPQAWQSLEEDTWRKPSIPPRNRPMVEKPKPQPVPPPPSAAPSSPAQSGTGTSSYRSLAQVSSLPRYHIDIPESEYPPEAIRNNIEGTVILEVYWDETGKVQKVEVLKGLGYGFEQLAINHLMKAVCTPATAGGQPVPFKGPMTFRFNLKKQGD